MCNLSTEVQSYQNSNVTINGERRAVIKIGSSCVIAEDGSINHQVLGKIVDRVVELKTNGIQVTLVSSGAVAAGRWHLKQIGQVTASKQEAAQVGQELMAQAWSNAFASKSSGLLVRYSVLVDRELSFMAQDVSRQQEDEISILNGDDVRIGAEDHITRDNDLLASELAQRVDAEQVSYVTRAQGTEHGAQRQAGTGGFESKSREIARLQQLGLKVDMIYVHTL